MLAAMLALSVLLPLGKATDLEPIRIVVAPQKVLIERGPAGEQYVNFDFVIDNQTDAPLRVSGIELSVHDEKNRLVLRRTLSEEGYAPAIDTIPDRELEKRQSRLLYNPFYVFDAQVPLKTMRYEFTVKPRTGKAEFKKEVFVSPAAYETKTDLILPLRKRFIVEDGHDFYSRHRRFDYLNPAARQMGVKSNFMRYAYDLCVVSEHGDPYEGSEDKNEDWLGFGEPVYATAGGKVAAVSDGMPDSRDFEEADVKARPLRLFGNYVVIDHRNGEFSLFGHLQEGSIQVKAGDTVKQGQILARIGASGSARIPHLHYELRTGSDLAVEGLPSYFRSFRRILGSRTVRVQKGRIDSGDVIEPEVPAGRPQTQERTRPPAGKTHRP